MVGVEVALSTVLLVVGGLLTLSFIQVLAVPKGFDAQQVITQDLSMSGPRFNDAVRYRVIDDAVTRLAALPGVRAVGVTSQVPLRGETWTCALRDATLPEKPETATANFRFVNEDLLERARHRGAERPAVRGGGSFPRRRGDERRGGALPLAGPEPDRQARVELRRHTTAARRPRGRRRGL